MDIRKLQRVIVDALEDVKGADIRVYNSTGLTQLFDRVIIASGTSNRQTRALAASVRDKVKSAGGQVVSVEGEETGEWVLVDLGDAIVHIMQPTIRTYYNLEELWGVKPVSMKSHDESAMSGRSDMAPAAPVKKTARTAVARKTAATGVEKSAAKTAARTPAKKAASKASSTASPKPASKASSRASPKPASKAAPRSAVSAARGARRRTASE